MGNTQSRILGSFYYVVYSLSALITLVCLFGIPRAQVVLVQAAAPTITRGTTTSTLGTSGSFGNIYNAKLDVSETKVVLADRGSGTSLGGPVLADVSPYAFLRRSSLTGISTTSCTFDGTEVSAASTAKVYCRPYVDGSATFLAYQYSNLAILQDGSSNNPLVGGGSSTIGETGMITVIPETSFLMLPSDEANGILFRVDVSSFTYSGTVTTTKTATDPSGSKEYRFGACDQTNCYCFSTGLEVGKFTIGSASTDPTYVSNIDLDQPGQLQSGSAVTITSLLNSIVLDTVNSKLIVAAKSSTELLIAKIDVSGGAFAFASRLVLTSPNGIQLCENCFTADGSYLMILPFNTATKDVRFIEVASMTEVTDAGSFIDTSEELVTAFLSQSSSAGGLISQTGEIITVTTTGVASTAAPTPVPTPVPPPATTTTTATVPPFSPVTTQQPSSGLSEGAIIGIATGSAVAGVLVIVGLVYLCQYYKSDSSSFSPTGRTTGDASTLDSDGETLKEVR